MRFAFHSLCCQDSTVPFSSVSNWKLPFERLKRSSLTRRRMSEFVLWCVIWSSRLPTPMDSSCLSEISCWKNIQALNASSQFSKLSKLISLHSPSWSFDSERNKVMVSSGDHSTVVPPASTNFQSVQHQNLTEWLSSVHLLRSDYTVSARASWTLRSRSLSETFSDLCSKWLSRNSAFTHLQHQTPARC